MSNTDETMKPLGEGDCRGGVEPADSKKASSARPWRVVAVDDEPMVLEYYKTLLSHWLSDVTVLAFGSGEKAWNEICRAEPDLLIMDWYRDGVDGHQMLSLIVGRKMAFPVLVVSGAAEQGQLTEFLDQGLRVSLLGKPFTPEELWRCVSPHFKLGENMPPLRDLREFGRK